jgi:flagellar protein FlaG
MSLEMSALELAKVAQKAPTGERVPAVDAAQPRQAQKPVAPSEAVHAVAKQIEAYLRSNNRSLEFRVDADTGRTVVSVRDSETGELIRQIPGDEVLRIAQAMRELTSLLNETA